IYQNTGIPTWRSLIFIKNAMVNNKLDNDLLIKQLNHFLITNGHNPINSIDLKK
ncbi:MAG: hypothetical protein RLZZ546_722, partial [Bacteroidota bacterium]